MPVSVLHVPILLIIKVQLVVGLAVLLKPAGAQGSQGPRSTGITCRACNGMEWNGMEDGMEEEFWYGIWKTSGMERNGRF